MGIFRKTEVLKVVTNHPEVIVPGALLEQKRPLIQFEVNRPTRLGKLVSRLLPRVGAEAARVTVFPAGVSASQEVNPEVPRKLEEGRWQTPGLEIHIIR